MGQCDKNSRIATSVESCCWQEHHGVRKYRLGDHLSGEDDRNSASAMFDEGTTSDRIGMCVVTGCQFVKSRRVDV